MRGHTYSEVVNNLVLNWIAFFQMEKDPLSVLVDNSVLSKGEKNCGATCCCLQI